MNSTSNLKVLAICGALLSGFWSGEALAANAVTANGSFRQSLSVDGPILLDVLTVDGAVDIRAANVSQVEITGHITARNRRFGGLFEGDIEKLRELVSQLENDPPVSLSDGRLQVGHIGDKALQRDVWIDYEIVVPMDTKVKSYTSTGSQIISGVAGPVETGTKSGELTLTDISNAVKARSRSGSIRAVEIAGDFEAHTRSGSVRLTQTAPGDVVVSTRSGSSELHGVTGALRVRARSGGVEVDGLQKGIWDLGSKSGSIWVTLPQDATFDLEARTRSGGITLGHPITSTIQPSKESSSQHLQGDVRGGGDLLKIETRSGDIRIR